MKYKDPDGNAIHIVVGAAIGAAVGGISAACAGGSARQIAAAAAGGAVTGGLAAATCGASLGVQIAGSAMAGTAGYCAEKIVAGEKATTEGMVVSAMGGAAGAMVGAILGKALTAYTSKAAQINYIRQKSIHNEGASKIMLGKYDNGGPTSYISKAGNEYEYFSLGNEWDAIKSQYGYTDKDMFKKFNIPFLDKGIKAGKTFQFSHNPVGDTGSLGKEFKYLMKNGSKWNPETLSAVPNK